MPDQPRELRLPGWVEKCYAPFSGTHPDAHCDSDDSDAHSDDSASAPTNESPTYYHHVTTKTGVYHPALTRASMPHPHVSVDILPSNYHVVGDDTTAYDPPLDRAPCAPHPGIERKGQVATGTGSDSDDSDDGYVGGPIHSSSTALVASAAGVSCAIRRHMSPPAHDDDPNASLSAAQQLYEDELRCTVSAEIELHPLHRVTLYMAQLECVDEARYVTHRHHMLIQSSFSLPGFSLRRDRREVYLDDEGHPRPYTVYIPYLHRRLWLSLLGTPDPSVSAQTRVFVRLVSRALKGVDEDWADFNTTSDIRFTLDLFGRGRENYLRARKDGEPVYVGRDGGRAPEGHVLKEL
ncbi:uncharacterized protein DNG_08146 [Cephalotrichum gorgonifer]|uniref:Uncharacterized protein n=1 Tax=Cephalotrichum gorgonifer TaxID=2041049 RepID=A0AAE8SY44_9PEZI|nr:uncharacterized protein DNG_08146 [Cephalotrichum gorgonifer]